MQIRVVKINRVWRQPTDKVGPDPLSGILAQVVVCQYDIDARLEGWINVVGPVGGEDENALVILQRGQEY